MASYDYLIVGGGMTAAAAVKGIRQADERGSIGLVSREEDPPYQRPPLSKGLWKGKPLEKIWFDLEQYGVQMHLGADVTGLDPQAKRLTAGQGDSYTYGKLLLATGGKPRRLPFGNDDILYFRTLADYRRLHAMTGSEASPRDRNVSLREKKQRFAVIGGGFIGAEIAAALCMAGQEVVMTFPEPGISALAFPPDLSEYINEYYRQKGIEIRPGELSVGLEKEGAGFALLTKGGVRIQADAVVAGIGLQPNVELAQAAGLEVDNGILVDKYLRSGTPDIYAAGDVANYYEPALDKRRRVEHEDNALSTGYQAGVNMASAQPAPYHHLPYFYSDLFELGYEAVGEIDSSLDTFADWQTPFEKGVVYYLQDGRLRGILLWNVWGQVENARKLIAQPGTFDPAELKGKLPA
jgi:3-phenylpropionate/trans-cinnamate dioxygenase ferredoxin reductase subunit